MRKLAVSTFLTLDGVMQAPGGPEGGPDRRVHARGVVGQLLGRPHGRADGRGDEHALRSTSAGIRTRSSSRTGPTPHQRRAPTSSTTRGSTSPRGRSIASTGRTAASSRVTPAKPLPGSSRRTAPRSRYGSWNLIQTLLRHDLVDEFRLRTFPVVLGTGKRLFGDGIIPGGLKVRESSVSTTGVVMATYEGTGPVDYGSFALEERSAAEMDRRRRLEEERVKETRR